MYVRYWHLDSSSTFRIMIFFKLFSVKLHAGYDYQFLPSKLKTENILERAGRSSISRRLAYDSPQNAPKSHWNPASSAVLWPRDVARTVHADPSVEQNSYSSHPSRSKTNSAPPVVRRRRSAVGTPPGHPRPRHHRVWRPRPRQTREHFWRR